jgi:hypothetical protein
MKRGERTRREKIHRIGYIISTAFVFILIASSFHLVLSLVKNLNVTTIDDYTNQFVKW